MHTLLIAFSETLKIKSLTNRLTEEHANHISLKSLTHFLKTILPMLLAFTFLKVLNT